MSSFFIWQTILKLMSIVQVAQGVKIGKVWSLLW